MADSQELAQLAQQYGGADPGILKYLQTFIDQGHLTPYEAAQLLQSTPQAQERRLPGQAQQYSDYMGQQDNAIMQKSADSLTSQFYQQGRPRSSGYVGAYANAARDLAISRQPMLAQFYGQGLQNVNNAYGQYGQQFMQRGQGLQDQARQRQWAIEDFYTQQNSYNDYLNAANRRNRNQQIGSLVGTGIGAAAGSVVPGVGTMMGARIGGALGGGFGGL